MRYRCVWGASRHSTYHAFLSTLSRARTTVGYEKVKGMDGGGERERERDREQTLENLWSNREQRTDDNRENAARSEVCSDVSVCDRNCLRTKTLWESWCPDNKTIFCIKAFTPKVFILLSFHAMQRQNFCTESCSVTLSTQQAILNHTAGCLWGHGFYAMAKLVAVAVSWSISSIKAIGTICVNLILALMETPALNVARQLVFTCEGIISSSILFFFQYGSVRFIVCSTNMSRSPLSI